MTDGQSAGFVGALCGQAARSRWLRIAAVNTLAAVTVAVVLAGGSHGRGFVGELVNALVFAHVIGGLAGSVLPLVARSLDWNRVRTAWLAITATLLAVAVVGSAAASLAIAGLGLVPRGEAGQLFAGSVRICVLITFGFGGGMMAYEIMRSRLRTTLAERERAEKLLAEARLASLESRLHPHFLFNTLNAISALIPEDPARAEKLVEQLAALLRFSLDAGGRHTVELATEVEIVRAYLGIEEARLGERLRWTIELAPDVGPCPVPLLALHTLVQNSVKHVAAAGREPTEIRVSAEAHGDRLYLEVWDSGEPFALESAGPGHGLDGLRARLAVLYGEKGRLAVEPAEPGKRVVLSLPR
jgi:two-component system, LytTR family, sensor histidine kinase AlgZ